jgi:hypothetical protein
MQERRTTPRRSFSYYVRVLDDDTQKTIGHLVDLSAIGMQLETSIQIPPEKDYFLRVELMPEISNQPFMLLAARSKWCESDKITPNMYYCGFEIIEMTPEDKAIYMTILNKFGEEKRRK